MKRIMSAVPHINIIIFTMLLVFYIINQFNTAMGFLNNDMTNRLIEIFAVTSAICSVRMIVYQRREVKQHNETIAASQSSHQEM